MNHFQEIDQYLNGELKEAEKIAFENRLNTEPDLRKAFEAQKKMESALNEIRTEQIVKTVGQKYRLIRKKRRTFLLVTASLLILFLLFMRYGQDLISSPPSYESTSVDPEIKDLVLSLYDQYNTLATTTKPSDPLLEKASIIPADPERALHLMKPFAGKNKAYDYYYAHALFKMGNYQEANLAFQRFRANITEADPLFQDYQFFHLLNLVMLGDASTYQSKLKSLLELETHPYHEALSELSSGLAALKD